MCNDMANKKKKKSRKHINRRKRAMTQAVQVKPQEPEIQRFLTKRSLICGLVILLNIVMAFFPESWFDNAIMRIISGLWFCMLVLPFAVLFYLNYTEKSVKVLYWTVFLSMIASLYLITWKYWSLIEFLALSALTVYACVVYMRENRKGTRKTAKVSKWRKITLNSFWPISMALVLRALILYLDFSNYSYMGVNFYAIGTGIGVVVAFVLIVWLCFSGYKYLERKDGENHSTALTAVLILIICIFFGWFAVAVPNQTFVVEKRIASCEIQDKYERNSRNNLRCDICVSIKGKPYSITVSSEIFEQYEIGDCIDVEVCKGLFGLEYFNIPQD